MSIKIDKNYIEISFNNGLSLNFIYSDNCVRGIERVELNGKALRTIDECIQPEFATPDGRELDHLEFVEVKERDNAVVIVTKPYMRVAHRMEWAEHAMHQRISTSSWSNGSSCPEGAFVEWIIKEENEKYYGKNYSGFSYSFHYYCPGYTIYQIEDKATWELSGKAEGNTFVMRASEPVAKLKRDSYYYSGWDLPGIANPHVFQHKPLYAAMQGFTFQYDMENILITVHERPSHVRSLFLKEKNDNKLLHFNQFCFDSTDDITTPARKILACKNNFITETSIMNHYLRVRDQIQQDIRSYYGIKIDKARPSAHVETWEIAKMDNFREVFKQLNEWGINRAFLMPLWRSNETDILPRFEKDKEQFGILGNMCCPIELKIAECYDGLIGFKRIMDSAMEFNLDTYMWFGSHFSSNTPLINSMKDLFAKDVTGQLNRNNYGSALFAINQNSKEYQKYLIDSYGKLGELGLKGIFRDSHFNMAADTINYLHIPYEEEQEGTTPDKIGFLKNRENNERDLIYSMHDTEIMIQKRFQDELNMLYYVESEGAIGTPMCGTNYDSLRGHEYIYSNMETGMNYERVLECGDTAEIAYFRGLSTGLFYQINIEVNSFPSEGSVDKWWNSVTMAPMVKAYLKVEQYLKEMWLLEDENGIVWKDGQVQIIFAYKDFEYSLEKGKNIVEVIEGKEFDSRESVNLQALHIYIIK